MAKIVHSDTAPSEAVHYSIGSVDFDLSGRKSYETKDPSVISAAEVHPWLTVQYDKVEVVQGAYREQVRPEDDPMVGPSLANDPEEARKAEAAKDAQFQPVALDAGEKQTDVVETGVVAETLAADDSSKTSMKS